MNDVAISLGSCGTRACSICRALGASERRPTSQVLDAIDQASRDGATRIRFTGHELLSHPGRRLILERLAHTGLRFIFPTSKAVSLTEPLLQSLRRLGLDSVDYWFSSFTPEIVQRIEGHRLEYRPSNEGLECLRRYRLLGAVRVPVTPFNRGELDSILLGLKRQYALEAEIVDHAAAFPAEIARAERRVAERVGTRAVRRPSVFSFLPQGEPFAFDPAACPLTSGDPTQRLPLLSAWLQEEDGRYRAYATDTEATEDLRLTKNIRGLLRRRDTQGDRPYARHPACRACPRLVSCGVCFIPTSEEPRAFLPLTADAARRDVGLPSPPQLEGACPIGIALPPGSAPLPFREALESWEAADIAALAGYAVADYSREEGGGALTWRLSLAPHTGEWRDQADGVAVLQISSACVARCVMCELPIRYAGQWVHSDDVARMLEELYLCGFHTCDIFGGEITLRSDFEELIALAKSIGLRVYVISTGYRLDRERVRRLADLGVDKITLSIDAPSAALHDEIKNRPGLFDHAMTALQALLDDGRIPIEINTVILRHNVYELPALHRLLAERGVRRHRLFYCLDVSAGLHDPPFLTEEQAKDFISAIYPQLLALSEEWGTALDWCPNVRFGTDALENEARRLAEGRYADPAVKCHAPEHELMLGLDGSLYPCPNPSVLLGGSIGHVGAGSLLAQLRGPAFARFRAEAGKLPFCESCVSKRV